MKKREILLDDESDRLLDSLAEEHSGDCNAAIRDVLRMRGTLEVLLDDLEESRSAELLDQRERSERGFREGRFTELDTVKKKLRL